MKVFLAGATGTIGRALMPMLAAAGHDVIGTTRTKDNLPLIAQAGAQPVFMDGLDAESVAAAVAEAAPDVVIHQLTALKEMANLKRFDAEFATTNRLRTQATDDLLTASRNVGVKTFIAQSFTGWTNPRHGGPVKTEDDGLDPSPTAASRETLEAIQHLEETVPAASGLTGIVLRYGFLYGPGTALGRGGNMFEAVAKRQLPVVGGGAGIWSFIHVDDAAHAAAVAVEHDAPGLYNIVDDEPAAVADWLPFLAAAMHAKPPRHIPTWIAKPLLGEHGIAMMTDSRGSSNAKAKRELGWRPQYSTWRSGFPGLVATPTP